MEMGENFKGGSWKNVVERNEKESYIACSINVIDTAFSVKRHF